MGIDPGFGSGKIVVTQFVNEYERPNFDDMINEVWRPNHDFNVSNIYVAAANPVPIPIVNIVLDSLIA